MLIDELIEKDIQELDYLTLFNGKKIVYNDYCFYHEKACAFSDELFSSYYDETLSLKDNLKSLKVNDVLEMNSTQRMIYNARAIYVNDERNIYLNQKDIDSIFELVKKYDLNISRNNLTDIIVSHELFHHLENIKGVQFDEYLNLHYDNDRDFSLYREIAAHHFSYLINKIKVEILDLLWLYDRNSDRLESYISYFKGVKNAGL